MGVAVVSPDAAGEPVLYRPGLAPERPPDFHSGRLVGGCFAGAARIAYRDVLKVEHPMLIGGTGDFGGMMRRITFSLTLAVGLGLCACDKQGASSLPGDTEQGALRLGHYSTKDGLTGLVLDRTGDTIRVRIDGSDDVDGISSSGRTCRSGRRRAIRLRICSTPCSH
jgi:hypothetical protein